LRQDFVDNLKSFAISQNIPEDKLIITGLLKPE
jgi:hypothetical protein